MKRVLFLALAFCGLVYVVSVVVNPIKCDMSGSRHPNPTAEQLCPGITAYKQLNMFQRLGRIVAEW
jgi:hypothetical protein